MQQQQKQQQTIQNINLENFLKKSREIHGDIYDYSYVVYKKSDDKVTIICNKHGEFNQTPSNHIYGHGCPKCGRERTTNASLSNLEDFLQNIREIHGDIYDYSMVNYINNLTEVTIICKKHGEFNQLPKVHKRGGGCPKCGREKTINAKRLNTIDFIEKSIKIHGPNYDYSKVVYVKSDEDVIIICNEHGDFLQKPCNHLNGQGCRECSIIRGRKISHYSLDEILNKFYETHKNIYDYSLVNYTNYNTSVIIICRKHGNFGQTPHNHIKGQGCYYCGRERIANAKRSNTDEFTQKSIEIYGNIYDYTQDDYKASTEPVKIICKIHGVFEQTPSGHLSGRGCQLCGIMKMSISNRSNTEEFIQKSILVHGDLYDYSFVNYIYANKNVTIICREHGQFYQQATSHLMGCGCPICGINSMAKKCSSNTEKFINKSFEIHGDTYDYSNVNYVNNTKIVEIICKEHGIFKQSPAGHLAGKGCQKCAKKYSYTSEEWIDIAKKLHGDRYDYSKSVYKSSNEKLTIICKIHGEFEQVPRVHLRPNGCPNCSKQNYSALAISYLNTVSMINNIYIQHAENGVEYKIPNTNFKVDGYCEETNTVYEFHGDFWHGNPKIYKLDGVNTVTKKKYSDLYIKTLEREEYIRSLGYNLVIMWENDWKNHKKILKTIKNRMV